MTKTTRLRVGIAFNLLSVLAVVAYFAAENARKTQVADLEGEITTLSERVETFTVQADDSKNGESLDSSELAAVAKSIRHELDMAESRLQRPPYLSNVAFVSWALLSMTGSFFTFTGAQRRKKSDHRPT